MAASQVWGSILPMGTERRHQIRSEYPGNEDDSRDGKMGFLEHLEELA